ncbi:hypothetical protein [Streptomyces niveus]|uniref:hypothetical protein n=1 Tax=Streptomyces niveus TaxID=193462 RepID=UPI00342A2062
MAEYDFPQDLRDAQRRLHQVTAAYHALCRTLPWSVEPAPGWAAGEKQPYTDHKSTKPESPGYTDWQRSEVARLRAAVLELSVTVSTHPYWSTLGPGTVAEGRMALKQTAPASACDVAAEPEEGAFGSPAARAA